MGTKSRVSNKIKYDPWLSISKKFILTIYAHGCLFWYRSHSDIDEVLRSFDCYGPKYNWEFSKGVSVY